MEKIKLTEIATKLGVPGGAVRRWVTVEGLPADGDSIDPRAFSRWLREQSAQWLATALRCRADRLAPVIARAYAQNA